MEKRFGCDICSKTFTHKSNMLRHRKSHFQTAEHVCSYCNKSFRRNSNLTQHMNFVCKMRDQQPIVQPQGSISNHDNEDIVEVMTALENRVKTYVVKSPAGDVVSCFERFKGNFESKIKELLTVFTALKFNFFVECEFTNTSGETCSRNFKTRNVAVYRTSNVMDIISKAADKIVTEKSECEMKKSGWAFDKLVRLELRVNKYTPLKGASFIKLPIHATRSVINVQNNDDYCFKYAILSKYVDQFPERVTKYLNNEDLNRKYNWNCVTFPVNLNDIKYFEKANDVSINVFSLNEQNDVYPLRICEEEVNDHFDLLYVSNEVTSHYCYIRNFARLVHSQLTSNCRKLVICKRCFAYFDDRGALSKDEKLTKHKELCKNKALARCEIPNYDIFFKNAHRSKPVRFVIYADFETILKPIHSCVGDPNEPWTNTYQQHIPYSYAYLLKDAENEHTMLREYRGPNAVSHFMQSVIKDIELVDLVLFGNKKLNVPTLTTEQQKAFDDALVCHICKKGEFTEKNYKVRNHCHVSGDYLGVAHRSCNLFYRDQNFIPCFIHNLSGYDGHFLIKEMGYDKENIRVIPNTDEKYVSFSKMIKVKHAKSNTIELRFLDSFRFMPYSLSALADNLSKDKFFETKKHFPEDKFEIVTKKGVFPYEYITDMTKLEEEELPPKSSFYSRLTDEHIDDNSYEHANNVWKTFNITSLGEYADVYVKSDTTLLCDIFESFRMVCMETYDLDPAYYFTVPGLAFDAMLKYTGVTLELMKDMDMVMMVEKGIRGGVTQCVKKHAVANNKYKEDFDRSKPSKYLMYMDANNLYGYALSKTLPCKGFEWCDVSNLDITKIPEDAEEGYFLEVDLEYPETLHDEHSDFAFCTENKLPPNGKTPKLLATVENKTNYVIHYVALQQALLHGLILKKVHRAIKFKQSAWMKPYIDLNTEKRKLAKHSFEKDFYKLMSNSVFGKTMESVRNRLDVRLVSDPKKADKLIAKPNFLHSTIYSEDLVAIQMSRTKVIFNKPIYCGLSVLDLSKTLMYSFHYDVMKPYYGDRINICYMDTDAYLYEIETDDVYTDFKNKFSRYLDTSDYPKDSILFNEENKKVVGKFKDELCGDILLEYVGLRSKMYAIKSKDSVTKKLKGIKKSVIKKHIKFEDYVQTLKQGTKTYTQNCMILSRNHEVSTIIMNKLTLSPEDDKRVTLEDNIHTLPYGHWRLQEEPIKKRARIV